MPRELDPRTELTNTVLAIEEAIARPLTLSQDVRRYLTGYADGIRHQMGTLHDAEASVYEFRYVVGFADGSRYAADRLPKEGV